MAKGPEPGKCELGYECPGDADHELEIDGVKFGCCCNHYELMRPR